MDLLDNRIEYLRNFEKEDIEDMVEHEQATTIRDRLQSLKSITTLTIYTVTIDELPGLSTQIFATEEAALDDLLDKIPIRDVSSYSKEQLKELYFSTDGDFWTVLQSLEDEDQDHIVYSLHSHTVAVG